MASRMAAPYARSCRALQGWGGGWGLEGGAGGWAPVLSLFCQRALEMK
jgi:hypothetical protein